MTLDARLSSELTRNWRGIGAPLDSKGRLWDGCANCANYGAFRPLVIGEMYWRTNTIPKPQAPVARIGARIDAELAQVA